MRGGLTMYNKKYRLEKIEEFNKHNPIYEDAEGSTCYPAYFNVGEEGWFLCEYDDWFVSMHRIRTSVVQSVEYLEDRIILTTQNTRFTFVLIGE